MKQQRGFTLVELIVVIVILGILAATAIPKFIDVSSQAKTAAANGLIGAINSAVNLCVAQWTAAGSPASGDCTMGGSTVDAVSGIPTTATIDDALQNFSGFTYAAPTFSLDADTTCTVTYATTQPYATKAGC